MTQAIDVTPDQRKTLLSLLANHLPNTEAWVYGSRVRWTSRPESDLDMAVFARPSQAHGVSALRDALEASDLPFRVDLLVWDEMPDSFRKQIQREHVVLAEANEVQSTRRVFGTGGCSDVGNEWRESTWGEEITLEYGKALRGHATSTGAYRVFGSNGPIGWTDKALAPGPGVILGRKGAYRGVQYSPNPFFVIDTAYYVVPKSQHDMRWLYFAIKHYKLGEIDDGSPIPSTTRAAVYPRKLFIPSFPEQRAIARILGTLDDKIELNRRMNETLETMARAIFEDWFVDFGPVRAKMEGRAPYLPQGIWKLFPRALDGKRKPLGWEISEIGDEVHAVGGSTPSTKDSAYWEKADFHWATPKDLSNLDSPVLLDTERKISDAGIKKISSGLLPAGTVLMSSRAPIGYVAVTEVPTAVNQGFIAMVCEKRLPNVFVLFWCDENLDYIKNIAGGSTFAEISKRAFRPIPVIVPPEEVLATFERIVRPLYDRIVANERLSRSLALCRDLLLPKLMSGENQISFAERVAEMGAVGSSNRGVDH